MPGEDKQMNQFCDLALLALHGVRVLEVGTGSALAYAGKLFADFGAEVMQVAPPSGRAKDIKKLATQSACLFHWRRSI